jgi:hypothetical protein
MAPFQKCVRGEDLNVIFYQNMPNLHNRYKSAERKISKKKPEHMLNVVIESSFDPGERLQAPGSLWFITL